MILLGNTDYSCLKRSLSPLMSGYTHSNIFLENFHLQFNCSSLSPCFLLHPFRHMCLFTKAIAAPAFFSVSTPSVSATRTFLLQTGTLEFDWATLPFRW